MSHGLCSAYRNHIFLYQLFYFLCCNNRKNAECLNYPAVDNNSHPECFLKIIILHRHFSSCYFWQRPLKFFFSPHKAKFSHLFFSSWRSQLTLSQELLHEEHNRKRNTSTMIQYVAKEMPKKQK